MVLFSAIIKWWRWRQRSIDMTELWPQICRAAPDLDTARNMFVIHCLIDPAWQEFDADELRVLVSTM